MFIWILVSGSEYEYWMPIRGYSSLQRIHTASFNKLVFLFGFIFWPGFQKFQSRKLSRQIDLDGTTIFIYVSYIDPIRECDSTTSCTVVSMQRALPSKRAVRQIYVYARSTQGSPPTQNIAGPMRRFVVSADSNMLQFEPNDSAFSRSRVNSLPSRCSQSSRRS